MNLLSVQEEFQGELANIYRAIILFCAEQERANIKLRTSGGRKVKARNGGYAGGRCPMGYKTVDGMLVVDEEQAEIVKMIFHLRFDLNKTYREIARILDEQGFTGKTGVKLLPATILYIINNKHFYEGYYKYGNEGWRKGVHEPIIQEGMYCVPND